MTAANACPKCGAELPADAPGGICPKCLMAAGLKSEPSVESSGEPKSTAAMSGFVPPDPQDLAKHFPQLEILSLLGKGGMGAVYLARQPALDRLVAVKILPPEVGGDPAFAERFTREARALAKLSHQHIVSVFDFGQADGLFYFIMEYVDGANLRQLIASRELAPEEALAIVPQICEALQFAHDQGVVHRDVKPENVLLDKQGRVRIADFGLAKLLGDAPAELNLTGTQQVMGTPHYMAPEQMQGSHAVDHRADIYSLGVVFYELLTGELPVGRFEPPSHRVQIDVRLDDVVLRSLESRPERRYQSAGEVKTDVESIRGSERRGDVGDASSARGPDARNEMEASSAVSGVRMDDIKRISKLTLFGICWFHIAWMTLGFLFEFGPSFVAVGAALVGTAGYFTLRRLRQEYSHDDRLDVGWTVRSSCAVVAIALYAVGLMPLEVAIEEKWERSTSRYVSSRQDGFVLLDWAKQRVVELGDRVDFNTDNVEEIAIRWNSPFSLSRYQRITGNFLIAMSMFAFATAAASTTMRLPKSLIAPSMAVVPGLGAVGLAAAWFVLGSGDFDEPDYAMQDRISIFAVPAESEKVCTQLEKLLVEEGYRVTSTARGRIDAPLKTRENTMQGVGLVQAYEAQPESIFDRWHPRRHRRVMPHVSIIVVDSAPAECVVRLDLGKLREDVIAPQWERLSAKLKNSLIAEAAREKKKTDREGREAESGKPEG